MEYFRLEGGEAAFRELGGRVELTITIQNDGRGLYRGWLKGAGGRIDLGALIPTQNRLGLRRSLPIGELRQKGCYPITEVGLTLAHAFGKSPLPQGWKEEPQPARLFPCDPILQKAAEGLSGCLLCRSGEGFSLAVPYHRKRPLGMTPIFCFGRVRTLGGDSYIVFPFDGEGVPRL